MQDVMPEAAGQVLIGVVIVVLILVLFSYARRKPAEPWVFVEPGQIARIEGKTEFTPGGAIAVVMLVIFNLTALASYYMATTILQQTVFVLGGISASTFWGVFVIIGRTQTYRVFRDSPPPEFPIKSRTAFVSIGGWYG